MKTPKTTPRPGKILYRLEPLSVEDLAAQAKALVEKVEGVREIKFDLKAGTATVVADLSVLECRTLKEIWEKNMFKAQVLDCVHLEWHAAGLAVKSDETKLRNLLIAIKGVSDAAVDGRHIVVHAVSATLNVDALQKKLDDFSSTLKPALASHEKKEFKLPEGADSRKVLDRVRRLFGVAQAGIDPKTNTLELLLEKGALTGEELEEAIEEPAEAK